MFLPRLVGEIGLLVDCRGLWGDQRAKNYAHPGFFSAMISPITGLHGGNKGFWGFFSTMISPITGLHGGDSLSCTEGTH